MAQSVGEVALDIVVGRNTVDSVVRDAMDDAQNTINRGSSGISGALGKLGGVAKGVAKGMAVGIGVASTAVVGLGKQAVDAYAEYEQLVGGVETLFKENASTVITNASNAYKTAGMSANEYMTTVTSFSASLLQSLGNDTVKASEMADMAITDMSDNANKMGTSMEMIQNAYQGFAKQNYTMLDNLKLGYGGTKTEMERLLADAQAISGIKYDISSYADVVDAIHVIQTEMGITGTTAKEASSTIQGSISSMKSAWTNLLTGLSDPTQNLDQLIDNLVNSITAVGANLMPRITLVLDGIVKLVSELAPKLVAEIPKIVSQVLPSILSGAIKIVDGIVQALPQLIGTLVSMLPTLLPMLIDGIVNMIVTLASSFADIIQPIIDNLPEIIISIVNALTNNLPALIQGCIKLVIGIVSALPQIIMALIEAIPQIIVSIVEALFNALPILLEGVASIFGSAWDVIVGVFSGVIDFFSGLFSGVVDVIKTVFSPIINIISGIWDGIKNIFAPVINFFSSIFSGAVNAIKSVFSVITGIFSGIWNGVKNIFAGVKNFFTDIFWGAVNGIKSIFSPIVDFFSGIWSKITGIFSRVGEIIGNAISSVVGKAVNAVLSVACGIINGFISAINFAIDLINAIPGVEIDKLKKLDVPQMEKGGVLKKGQVGLLEGNGSEAVVPLEKNLGWLTRIADMLDERMAGRGTLIAPPALENVRAGNRTESHNDNQSKIDELIELIKRLLEDDNEPTPIPIYIGNELVEEYILNKNSRTVLRSGGRA